jgi:hypothetical protein
VSMAEPAGKVLYTLDFTQQPDGSALEWLEKNKFFIELDARKLNPRFENHQLVLSTDEELAGLIGLRTDDKNISGVERVEIEWGVSKFPEGANWETGNNRVALAVMIFFGTEKLSSGLPFGINSAPYFFSPFVGKVEPQGKMYLGKLYKEGGRYFSVAAPKTGAERFTTDFEVQQRFQTTFKKQKVPIVSGIAFQMNTQDTSGGAVASIRKISLIGP